MKNVIKNGLTFISEESARGKLVRSADNVVCDTGLFKAEISLDKPRIRCGDSLEMWVEEIDDAKLRACNGLLYKDRVIYKDVVSNVDIIAQIFDTHVALQKVIRKKGAARTFKTGIRKSEAWRTADSPMGMDNWQGGQAKRKPGDESRRVFVDQEIEKRDGIFWNTQTVKDVGLTRDRKTRAFKRTTDIVYPIRLHAQEIVNPGVDANDGHECNDTTWTSVINHLSLRFGSQWCDIGVCFVVPNITQGATINSANIQFNKVGGAVNSPSTCYGDAGLVQTAFTQSDRPSQMSRTAASAPFVDGVPANVNVQAIVQEIVNNGSWAPGSMMRFVVVAGKTPYWSSYWGSENNYSTQPPPQLTIDWDAGGPSVSIPALLTANQDG